eukprot:scaffold312981_cov19-Tisochrysis_lutea.AAC.1
MLEKQAGHLACYRKAAEATELYSYDCFTVARVTAKRSTALTIGHTLWQLDLCNWHVGHCLGIIHLHDAKFQYKSAAMPNIAGDLHIGHRLGIIHLHNARCQYTSAAMPNIAGGLHVGHRPG